MDVQMTTPEEPVTSCNTATAQIPLIQPTSVDQLMSTDQPMPDDQPISAHQLIPVDPPIPAAHEIVYFDLETGALNKKDDILQIAAICCERDFNVYVTPT